MAVKQSSDEDFLPTGKWRETRGGVVELSSQEVVELRGCSVVICHTWEMHVLTSVRCLSFRDWDPCWCQ
jgi:hypothetical protein